MIALVLALIQPSPQFVVVARAEGQDAAVRVVNLEDGLHTQFMVKANEEAPGVAAEMPPNLQFETATQTDNGIALTGKTFSATIDVPKTGGVFSVAVTAKAQPNSLKDARLTFTLARDETLTFRFPTTDSIVPFDRLANPVGALVGESYGFAIVPDVAALAMGRAMNPSLQVTRSTASYGFLPYDRDAEWNAKPAARNLDNPAEFSWKLDLAVSTADKTVDLADRLLWSNFGAARALSPLPQTIPFRYYTKPAFDMNTGGGEEEEEGGEEPTGEYQGLWWVSQMAGKEWRAPVGKDRLAKFTTDGNVARFAWALRWWAEHLEQEPWIEQADEVARLIAAMPDEPGKTVTAFDVRKKAWVVAPFDAQSAAFTARWKLKYAEDFFSTSSEALLASVTKTAEALLASPATGTTALFLDDVAKSKAVTDQSLKDRASAYLTKNKRDLKALASDLAQRGARPDAEGASLALVLARLGEPEAQRLVSVFYLHQAVAKPTTVTGTEAFGGFVGDHFVDETQSVFAADLLETAILVGDQHYAERAVAAVRAPLALFNHQTHSIAGMFFPPDIVFGKGVSWFGDKGLASYGPWRGMAEGMGQTLATLGQVYKHYGALYTHKKGWTIGIDGLRVVDGKVYSAFSTNPVSFEGVFPFEHVDASVDSRTTLRDPDQYPAVRGLTLDYSDNKVHVIALPGFSATDASTNLKGTFTFADGSTRPAQILPAGLGTDVVPELLAKGPVSFTGSYHGVRLEFRPTVLVVGPPSPSMPWPYGWRRTLGLSDVVATSVAHEGKSVLSTADNGRKGRDKALTGVIESVPFLVTQNAIAFTLLGDMAEGLKVELIDPATNIAIAQDTKQAEGSEDVVWELFQHVGSVVVFRITDTSKTAAIEVKDLRMAKAGPN